MNLFVWLVWLVFFVVLIGVGIGIGLVVAAIAVVMVLLGVVSSSAALGLFTKRPATAVRAFLLQCGVLSGIAVGGGAAWLGGTFFEQLAANWMTVGYGCMVGAMAGVVLALVMDFIYRRLQTWVEQRVHRSELLG